MQLPRFSFFFFIRHTSCCPSQTPLQPHIVSFCDKVWHQIAVFGDTHSFKASRGYRLTTNQLLRTRFGRGLFVPYYHWSRSISQLRQRTVQDGSRQPHPLLRITRCRLRHGTARSAPSFQRLSPAHSSQQVKIRRLSSVARIIESRKLPARITSETWWGGASEEGHTPEAGHLPFREQQFTAELRQLQEWQPSRPLAFESPPNFVLQQLSKLLAHHHHSSPTFS